MITDLNVLASQLKLHHDWVEFEYNQMSRLIIDIIEESSDERELKLADKDDHEIYDEYLTLHALTTKALILLKWQREQMCKHIKHNGQMLDNLAQLTQPIAQYEQAKQNNFCLIRPSS
ncbi:hypothetical protein [Oscillatoria sp. FACHB-1406]|uniref:hypothetical protein n=1 Tax=Oscillatoria sp. FACHB-1406 TaxID=2692846 RepID=UPI00168793EB|nr:hypothetical protein [Oscillatoria sp. FACHB-1406]MBD2578637.1 hypothetical protein [Oscillatoria sp. FACHB-1406]